MHEGATRFFGGIMFMDIDDANLTEGRRVELAKSLVNRLEHFDQFLKAARQKAVANQSNKK